MSAQGHSVPDAQRVTGGTQLFIRVNRVVIVQIDWLKQLN